MIALPEMTVFRDLEQGTDEWLMARLGVPTASEFDAILTCGRGGKPSAKRLTYMYKLIGERLTDEPSAKFDNYATRRGHELEPEARELYTMLTGNEVEQVGFIARGKWCGASPDGLIGEPGMLEIKTKAPHLQIPVLLSGEVPAEHTAQLQGQLWVAEREWVDFLSYWPGLQPFLKRVYRDDDYISKLASAVEEFHAQMAEIMEKVKAR